MKSRCIDHSIIVLPRIIVFIDIEKRQKRTGDFIQMIYGWHEEVQFAPSVAILKKSKWRLDHAEIEHRRAEAFADASRGDALVD